MERSGGNSRGEISGYGSQIGDGAPALNLDTSCWVRPDILAAGSVRASAPGTTDAVAGTNNASGQSSDAPSAAERQWAEKFHKLRINLEKMSQQLEQSVKGLEAALARTEGLVNRGDKQPKGPAVAPGTEQSNARSSPQVIADAQQAIRQAVRIGSTVDAGSRDIKMPPNKSNDGHRLEQPPKAAPADSAQEDRNDAVELLSNPHAAAWEKLKAVEVLARQNVETINLNDANGVARTCRVELETLGRKTLIHLFAQDETGHEHPILRGISNGDGTYAHEQNDAGTPVSYIGSWWTSSMDKSKLSVLGGIEAQ